MTEQEVNRLKCLQEDVQDAAVNAEQARVRLKKAMIAFSEAVDALQTKPEAQP